MSADLQPKPEFAVDTLAAARTGDHDAFAALVTPFVPRLQRLARRFTRNVEDAEDVCQESLLKAFTKLHHFAGTQNGESDHFRSWLMKITANSAIDFVRRKRSSTFVPLEQYDETRSQAYQAPACVLTENPEACYTRKERSRMLAELITQLPTDLRDVCLLRNIIGLSTREVAARLEISTIAVRLRLFRAHGRLRNNLRLASSDHEQRPRLPVRRKRTRSEAAGRNKVHVPMRYGGRTECAFGD